MTRKKPVEWTRLDNAAKIFPPTSNEKDTKVFRFVCELRDDIDKDTLQEAADSTITLFPFYRVILRRGVFWYYFENTELMPEVREEQKLPCSMLYHPNRRNLLFQITYYKKRINLEVFHALTDGTGALDFFKTLLYYYIISRYREDFKDSFPDLDYDASLSQRMDDSFLKHYSGKRVSKRIRLDKAYQIQGRRTIDNRIKVIEGEMPADKVIELAHRYNTTLTVYLTALFIYAIHQEMSLRGSRYPVILSVPVNLRSYFPSVTARNFFGTISIRYQFGKGKDSLEDIIESVKTSFENELTEEKLRRHMNQLASLEHNAAMRVVPLVLKDIVLRIAGNLSDRGTTAALSNVGRIVMAKELTPYMNIFNCFTSAKRPQICICSFENRLLVSFVSPYLGTDVQKNFYRFLTGEGIPVTVTSNVKEE